MVKLNKKVEVQVEASTVEIYAKVSDCGFYTLKDQNEEVIHQHDGYVPAWVPGDYGDYLSFRIDLETGQILNWRKPTTEELENWIEST